VEDALTGPDHSRRAIADAILALVDLMARLRSEDGCPWDRAQDAATLKPYLIEEAHEVADAIDGGDVGELRDELGDLLFQIVFQSRLLDERGLGDLGDVARAITAKMVRRHPHVFSNAGPLDTPGEVADRWEVLKENERRESGRSLLDGLPVSLPALTAASRMGEKASSVGFAWPNAAAVRAKLSEELGELDRVLASGDAARIEDELGDVLFVLANLGRMVGAHPEEALRAANRKFRARFGYIESRLRERGLSPSESTLAEMERLWSEAKLTGL
jgi:MazG family protein